MKKVPGNVRRELKDKKYEALVNNLPIDGEYFYNSSISCLSENERLSKKIFLEDITFLS